MDSYTPEDLKMRQSLPLDAKIALAQKRIMEWHDSWTRFEIKNQKTGHIRYATKRSVDDVKLRDNETIESTWGGADLRFFFRRQGFHGASSPHS